MITETGKKMEQVTIPCDYFLNMSKKDYSDYQSALIREFFQNSYDAGSKTFGIHTDSEAGKAVFTDDGCGMDETILREKLLVLGESHKNSPDAVGAFGHAKLLLYFSWEKWEIRTQNLLVTGAANYFNIEVVDDWYHGTKSTIWIPDNLERSIRYSIDAYFRYCDTNCKVTYSRNTNDPIEIKQGCVAGQKIFDGESFNIYEGLEIKGYYMLIRQNGILMFKQFLNGNGYDDPMPILEIKKSPVEMLMQNRDYFKKPYDQVITKVTNQLATESIGSFKVLHEGNRGVMQYSSRDIFSKVAKPSRINLTSVTSYEMTDEEALHTLSQKRTLRLLAICESYYEYMMTEGFSVKGSVTFGITNNSEGMCKKIDDGYQIFISIRTITKHSPNYRKMSVLLFNIIKHELAHAKKGDENDGEMHHDEKFVRVYDRILDTFWDTVPVTKIFKQTWKEF